MKGLALNYWTSARNSESKHFKIEWDAFFFYGSYCKWQWSVLLLLACVCSEVQEHCRDLPGSWCVPAYCVGAVKPHSVDENHSPFSRWVNKGVAVGAKTWAPSEAPVGNVSPTDACCGAAQSRQVLAQTAIGIILCDGGSLFLILFLQKQRLRYRQLPSL